MINNSTDFSKDFMYMLSEISENSQCIEKIIYTELVSVSLYTQSRASSY